MPTDSQPLSGYRVLVVEDIYFVAAEVKAALLDAGAAVEGPYGDLVEVSAALRRDGFDLAVLDLKLRGHDIYPIAEGLTAMGVPFLFATSYAGETVMEKWRDVLLCPKPFDPKELVNKLTTLVSRSKRSKR